MSSQHQLRRGRALVLIGAQGCGKSRMARAIAERYGSFAEIDVSILASPFQLGTVLDEEPATIIVEGLPDREETMLDVKRMLCADVVRAHRKNKSPRLVKAPNFIFCSGEADPVILLGNERRFLVVPVRGNA